MTRPVPRSGLHFTEDTATHAEVEPSQPQTHTEYMRDWRANNDRYRKRDNLTRRNRNYQSNPVKPFAGADTEGATIGDSHRMVLFRMGDHVLKETTPGSGLAWYEILDWLCNLPTDKIYVGFNFNYDVNMILKSYPHWPHLIKLVTTGKVTLGDDRHGYWFVEWMPRMHFAVKPMTLDKNAPQGQKVKADPSRGHHIAVSDTIKFFQTAFVDVMDTWEAGTPEQRDKVRRGKERRAIVKYLDPVERDETDYYNELECIMLAEIMEKFRDACHLANLRPNRWESPAGLARAMFKQFKVPQRKLYEDDWPKEVLEIGRAAYYGGRFEVAQFGPVPGLLGPTRKLQQSGYLSTFSRLITEVDRKSAYPYAATFLPCPECARWENRPPQPGEYAMQYAHAEYNGTPDDMPYFMGLPHRDEKGRISFPLETEGWYWNFELAEVRHQTVLVADSWTWITDPNCKHHTFGFLPDMFDLRQNLEREHKNRGLPVKLAINAVYGLLAQTIGEPAYSNHVLASFITAHCRTAIMRLVHEHGCEQDMQCGSNVVMIATDAVYFAGDPGIKSGKNLGDWECKDYPDGLFIVQAGVYFTPGGAIAKTRGAPKKLIQDYEQAFRKAFKRMMLSSDPRDGIVALPYQRFVGMRESVHRRSRRDFCQFVKLGGDNGRKLGFDWRTKRTVHPRHWTDKRSRKSLANEPLWTVPKAVENFVSTPYPKLIPDWHRMPVDTPDAIVNDMLQDGPDWLARIESPMDDYDTVATV